jgi:hypothetical protein
MIVMNNSWRDAQEEHLLWPDAGRTEMHRLPKVNLREPQTWEERLASCTTGSVQGALAAPLIRSIGGSKCSDGRIASQRITVLLKLFLLPGTHVFGKETAHGSS